MGNLRAFRASLGVTLGLLVVGLGLELYLLIDARWTIVSNAPVGAGLPYLGAVVNRSQGSTATVEEFAIGTFKYCVNDGCTSKGSLSGYGAESSCGRSASRIAAVYILFVIFGALSVLLGVVGMWRWTWRLFTDDPSEGLLARFEAAKQAELSAEPFGDEPSGRQPHPLRDQSMLMSQRSMSVTPPDSALGRDPGASVVIPPAAIRPRSAADWSAQARAQARSETRAAALPVLLHSALLLLSVALAISQAESHVNCGETSVTALADALAGFQGAKVKRGDGLGLAYALVVVGVASLVAAMVAMLVTVRLIERMLTEPTMQRITTPKGGVDPEEDDRSLFQKRAAGQSQSFQAPRSPPTAVACSGEVPADGSAIAEYEQAARSANDETVIESVGTPERSH